MLSCRQQGSGHACEVATFGKATVIAGLFLAGQTASPTALAELRDAIHFNPLYQQDAEVQGNADHPYGGI